MAQEKQWIDQIFRVVCVVEDLDRTLENWKLMVKFDEDSIETGYVGAEEKCQYHGKEVSCPVRFADFDMGGISMRLIEPLNKNGGDPYSDTLIKKGQGIHHLEVFSRDGNALLERYEAMGIHPSFSIYGYDNKEIYRLYDFEQTTGLSVEIETEMEGPCAR